MSDQHTIIGRAEPVTLPTLLGKEVVVVAKVDTGADRSSLWASEITETADGLQFKVFGPESAQYTGEVVTVPKGDYRETRIENSFGQRETRFVIKTPILIRGRRVLASFTLADRSSKTYPMLLGRSLLHGKFVVNVAEGEPLRKAERAKTTKMKLELQDRDDTLGV